ncbi:unnamed protein product [Adineta steineri]|nr:unnamed protein product [Adineta steineri]
MSTKIGCQGAQYLADGLKNNTTLIKLEIGQNPIEVQQQRYLTKGETAESSPLDSISSSNFVKLIFKLYLSQLYKKNTSSHLVCTTTTTLVASCHSYEVSWNNHCYYLDGSGGNCTSGYSQATNSVLTCIATQFAGKTYRSTISSNCCVWTTNTYECYELTSNCNSAGPFTSGPVLACTNAQQHFSQQLTFCGSN